MNNSFIDRVNAIVQQNQPTDPAYPDAGIGALENVANNVPRQTVIADQPHMLAYINPQEEQALRDMGGAGLPGPDGIPSYFFFGGSTGFGSFGDKVAETASNVGSSISNTASNIGSSIRDTFTGGGEDDVGNFGRVGDVLGGIGDDLGITDYGTNDTVYGAGPVEQVTSTPLPDREPNELELSLTSTKTYDQALSEARAAGQENFMFMGNYYPVPVEEPVETTNSVVAQDFGQVYDASGNRIDAGALPSGENSLRETIANIITPFDGAKYIDGVLTNTTTGEDMTGGGTATGLFGENTVYGVSDDPTNNPQADTDMGRIEQQMLQDIPPSDLAYFGSFFGNNVIPVFGGMLAGKMLDQGIEGRRAIMDEQISALEAGATPLYDDAGNYTGFDRSTMTGNVSAILDEYGAEGLLPGGLPEDVATEENKRFQTVFDVQSISAENDPTGMSTEDGFITSDGTEYYINGDGTVQEVTDGKINYDASGGETVESVYGVNDEQIIRDDPVVKSIYNKYYKSGKGTFLPAWLRRFSSGVSIDELLTKIEVDGEIKYQTPEGEIIDAKYITGAIVGPDTTETE